MKQMLQENTLFGVEDKVKEAVAILQQYEPQEGYYLAFSGGKDSLVCYWLCKLAGVRFEAHYNYTTIDPPELVQFVRTFDDVEIHHPGCGKTMWDLIVKNIMPPTRRVRYCCKVLKEPGGKDRVKILGVRAEESSKRKGREVVMIDGSDPLGRVINIIYHWSEAEVWEFIGCNMIEYCSLYDEGFSRLGCVACPLGGPKKMMKEFARWPAYRRAYIKCFERMIVERQRRGIPCWWRTGEDVMDWWLYGTKEDEQQMTIFALEGGEEDGRRNS